MNKLEIPAYAKVNLLLEVTGKRPDGYHELETVFQRVSLHDTLILARRDEAGIVLQDDLAGVSPENNLVVKAYRKLLDRCPALGGISAQLIKRIPTEAGLGGGSADAAALLLGANRLYSLKLTDEELVEIGASLGADVPTCLFASPMLGAGIGEKLTPICCDVLAELVILHPQISCSTPAMYRRLDARTNIPALHGSKLLLSAMRQNDLDGIAGNLYNVFESVLPEREIASAREALLSQGAMSAMLTGSGSAVFGIFANTSDADRAAEALSGNRRVYRCHFISEGRDYL